MCGQRRDSVAGSGLKPQRLDVSLRHFAGGCFWPRHGFAVLMRSQSALAVLLDNLAGDLEGDVQRLEKEITKARRP